MRAVRLETPWLRHIRGWDWSTIALILCIKGLLFSFAVQCVTAATDEKVKWMEIWNRWDAMHYLRLAEKGYISAGEGSVSIVFYPLYPWLVRVVAFVTQNYLAAAFVVSGIASIAAGLLLQRLARADESEAVARNSVWFLFIFPTSYFLHIGYTESLFLALILGSFLAARGNCWSIAGLLGACACLTRVNGLLLAPALALEAWTQYRASRRINLRWLWIGVVPLGFVIYLLINYNATGDFFAFSKIMEEHWFKKFTTPWFAIRDVWRRVPEGKTLEGLHEFFFIVFGLVCTIWCWLRLRPSYALWMTCNWLLINSTAFVVSVPRYLLAFFPIFILFARAGTNRRLWFAALTVWSLLYLALYAGRFVQGLWAF
jgi:Gpi18-like mannosyltransferase